jgi:hypothetical protein
MDNQPGVKMAVKELSSENIKDICPLSPTVYINGKPRLISNYL